jgi:hypothetical protein
MHNFVLDDYPVLVNSSQIVGRLYRNEFLKINKIIFTDRRRNGEDLLFNFYTVFLAKQISMVHNVFVYNYFVGNYIEKATVEKCVDARDNLIEVASQFFDDRNSLVCEVLMRLFASFITQLERADKSYRNDTISFQQYISGLRPLAVRVRDEFINELPDWRKDIIRFIQSGYSAGALRRWKNRNLYWTKWECSSLDK